MATTEEVKKLAGLARIKIEDAELEKFTSEFDAILAYVGQIEKLNISSDGVKEKQFLRNVMRDDGKPNASGEYTDKIVEQFPSKENNALSVKQIISHEEVE